MIEVELPDGTIVEFPEGTSTDVMERALASYASPQTNPEADMSFMGRLKDNIVGNDDGVMSFGEKVGTFLNKGGESMTMGLVGDEASAAVESLVPGVDYETRRDHYRAQEARLEQENPIAALTADIGGAMVAPVGAVGALRAGAGLLPRMLAGGAATGAMSGVYGFAEGEGGMAQRLDDAKGDATVGGLLGMAIPLAGAGLQKGLNARAGRKAVNSIMQNADTTQDLYQAGSNAYKAVDDAGVALNRGAISRMEAGIDDALGQTNYSNLPGTKRMMKPVGNFLKDKNYLVGQMDELAEQGANPGMTFGAVEQLRRSAGTVAGDMNPANRQAGVKIKEALDDFMKTLGPEDATDGDPEFVVQTIDKARSLWSRMRKSGLIDDVIEGSEDYLSGPASGVRNGIRSLLRNKKTKNLWSPAEKAILRKVVSGGVGGRLINLMGGGLGTLGQVGTGFAAGGIPGMMAGAGAAQLTSKASEAMTMRNAEIARAVLANGGLTALPAASTRPAGLLEQILRQGTAATLQ